MIQVFWNLTSCFGDFRRFEDGSPKSFRNVGRQLSYQTSVTLYETWSVRRRFGSWYSKTSNFARHKGGKTQNLWFLNCHRSGFEGRDSSVFIATRYGMEVRGSNPGGDEIFRTRPDRPWGPPSLLYNEYRVFAGWKTAGAWRWPPTPSSVEFKERIELYLYFPLDLRGLL